MLFTEASNIRQQLSIILSAEQDRMNLIYSWNIGFILCLRLTAYPHGSCRSKMMCG